MSLLENNRAVIFMFKISLVAKGVEKMLSEIGYIVTEQVGGFDSVDTLIDTNDIMILYLPDELMDDTVRLKELTILCRALAASGKPVIAIGEKKLRDDFCLAVSEINRFIWEDRPVDSNRLVLTLEKAASPDKENGRKKRVLIVDDDPYYARMVREWIRDCYRADVVLAGMQALSYLLKCGPDDKVDLILLDYEMPVVDGPQVFQMLRQEHQTSDIPVVFLTGVGTKEAVTRVMELKPDGYLLKNTTRENLLCYLKKKLGE